MSKRKRTEPRRPRARPIFPGSAEWARCLRTLADFDAAWPAEVIAEAGAWEYIRTELISEDGVPTRAVHLWRHPRHPAAEDNGGAVWTQILASDAHARRDPGAVEDAALRPEIRASRRVARLAARQRERRR